MEDISRQNKPQSCYEGRCHGARQFVYFCYWCAEALSFLMLMLFTLLMLLLLLIINQTKIIRYPLLVNSDSNTKKALLITHP